MPPVPGSPNAHSRPRAPWPGPHRWCLRRGAMRWLPIGCSTAGSSVPRRVPGEQRSSAPTTDRGRQGDRLRCLGSQNRADPSHCLPGWQAPAQPGKWSAQRPPRAQSFALRSSSSSSPFRRVDVTLRAVSRSASDVLHRASVLAHRASHETARNDGCTGCIGWHECRVTDQRSAIALPEIPCG